ncbi:MAG TPA: menaquinone biosynthesis protein [Sphingobacteriaceae bacterium]|nr:menaquinone biosynthesis protein [Sphingobacteriaceae bacterium]
MDKIRVSAVSYTNSKPFVYGLQHSEIANKIELSLDIPFECAKKLIEDRADIGLIPVAAMLLIPQAQIISDYCIGADGEVNSVFLFSQKPITEIKTFMPDAQSRTSNGLLSILFKHYWKVDPRVADKDSDAFIEIGDRTFGKKTKYPFVYDLAEEWKKFTGLPFVFAVWAVNKKIDDLFITEFNNALKYGLEHIDKIINSISPRNDFDVNDYLTHKISYTLDEKKRKALKLYLNLLKEL